MDAPRWLDDAQQQAWRVVAAAPGHVEAVRRFVFDALDQRDVTELARICDTILERLDAQPHG